MWLMILIFALVTNAEPLECKAVNDARKILLQNYPHIRKKLDMWVMPSPHSEVFDSTKNKLIKLLEKFEFDSKSNIDNKTVYDFIGSIRYLNEALAGTRVITDTVCINILANLLRCEDEDNAQLARHVLANETSFDALKAQSQYIKLNLNKSQFLKTDIVLYSILNLTGKERDSISNTRNPLQYKANVGDTIALDSLISEYRKAMGDSQKRLLANILMATGQRKAVKAALEDFGKPVYDVYKKKAVSCTSSTFQRDIVRKLERYYPYDTLFSKDYGKMSSVSRANLPEQHGKVLLFWNRLRIFFWKNYQVKLDEKPPYMSIFLSCGPDIYWVPK